jgi:hypothetical protein
MLNTTTTNLKNHPNIRQTPAMVLNFHKNSCTEQVTVGITERQNSHFSGK